MQEGLTDNDYLYTGEQYDEGLSQYYLRARYYDQGVGRFTGMDTWMGRSQDPVTLHKYLYGNLDPINTTDPTGQFGITSAVTAVSVTATLVGVGFTSFDITTALLGGDVTAPEVGMIALASVGGIKLFKIVGKKLLNRLKCGKPNENKVCNIFKSDRQRIDFLRDKIKVKKGANIAFVDYLTTDGLGTMAAVSGKAMRLGAVDLPSPTRYFATATGNNDRETDSEKKLYENLALRINTGAKGVVRLVSERDICSSCRSVGRQFQNDFLGIVLLTRGGVGSSTLKK